MALVASEKTRQKLTGPEVVPPLEAGRPLWADDVNFNLTYHIRHTALPEPGGEAQLKQLAGRVFSQQLDRSKPLWELWLAQGLERDRFAILTKTHHAMVDGVSGVDIGTVLFDLEPVPAAVPVEDDWVPQPEPGTTELVARGISDLVATPIKLAERAVVVPEGVLVAPLDGVLLEVDPRGDSRLVHELGDAVAGPEEAILSKCLLVLLGIIVIAREHTRTFKDQFALRVGGKLISIFINDLICIIRACGPTHGGTDFL